MMNTLAPVNSLVETDSFLAAANPVRRSYHLGETVIAGDDPADSVFYILKGSVKCTAISRAGKERIVAIFKDREFLGEECVTGQTRRFTAAIAMTPCTIARIDKAVMTRILYEEPKVAELFIMRLVERHIRYQADLADHLLNKAEQRLARALMLLAESDPDRKELVVVERITQEALAEIVGTTRSRVNYFMRRFIQRGFIEYDKAGRHIRINRSAFGSPTPDLGRQQTLD